MKRLAGVLILGAALLPSVAHAEVTVTILGLRSATADEQIASQVTGALRKAARSARRSGLTVSDRQNQLSQLLVVFDCEEPTPQCLQEIGRSLSSQRLIYGLIEPESGRANAGYAMTLRFFNVESGQIERDLREVIPRNVGAQPLAEQASRFFAALTGTSQRGELTVRSAVEGAAVRLGGREVGNTSGGPVVIRDLEPGEVELEVSREGYTTFTQTVEIEAGENREVTAELSPVEVAPGTEPVVGDGGTEPPGDEPPPPPPPPVRRHRSLAWLGWTNIGLAVAFSGLGLWASLDVNDANGDAELQEHFLQDHDICQGGALGTAADLVYTADEADSRCRRASILEVLQFVFYGLAAVTVGFGIWIVVREARRSREAEEDGAAEALRLTVEPVALRDGGALSATLTF